MDGQNLSMTSEKTALSTKDYSIGWIAALPIERAAATAVLDETHEPPSDFQPGERDYNSYTWGCVSGHYVVIASLPAGGYGITNATTVAFSLVNSCPHIRIGLLVGIGAAIPECGRDIRLGDIAVSQPSGNSGGVVQYDTGKAKSGSWEKTGVLSLPPKPLLQALAKLQAEHELHDGRIPAILAEANARNPKFAEKFKHPHLHNERVHQQEVSRTRPLVSGILEKDDGPRIFYGTIGSGNKLVKDTTTRRAISALLGSDCICLEMEAAGLMNDFPCLVIRGISDYADEHKNDVWQRYAAANAAAFTKELLYYISKSSISDSAQISQILEHVDSGIQKLNLKLDNAMSQARARKKTKVLRHLYDHCHEERKNRNPKRMHGTCEWFINHDTFKQWLEQPGSSTLLATADPGCGKSVLARHLIDHVLPQAHRTICYFFFKDDFEDQKTAACAGRTMVHQALNLHRDAISDEIVETFEVCGDSMIDSFSKMWAFLIDLSPSIIGELICVLDGFDECRRDDHEELLRSISTIRPSRSVLQVKVLILTRPYHHIQMSFSRAHFNSTSLRLNGEEDIEQAQISREIDIVLSARIDEFCQGRGLGEREKQFLMEEFTAIPQRTYLWAYLTMEMLEDAPGFSRGSFRRILQRIPSSVEEAYEKILSRSVDATQTRLILQLVISSKRPWTIAEMNMLLNLDGSQIEFSELEESLEPVERFKYTLRHLCGLFIVILDSKVYLLHQTAREFLIRNDVRTVSLQHFCPLYLGYARQKAWMHSISEPMAHRILAERCLWLMTLRSGDFQTGELFQYATCSWVDHLELANVEPDDEILDLACRVCDPEAFCCEAWFEVFWQSYPTQRRYGHRERYQIIFHLLTRLGTSFPLVFAAFLGSTNLLKKHLLQSTNKWTTEARSQALWWGMSSDKLEIAELLLSNGADPNMTMDYVSTSLEDALQTVDSVKVATLKLRDKPLYIAVCFDNIQMVKLLLDNGADPNAFSEFFHDTALHVASARWSFEIIELLVNSGADLTLANDRGRTPLMELFDDYHGRWGHSKKLQESLRRLWTEEGKVLKDKLGNTPFHFAARTQCKLCIAWCLDHDADRSAKNANGETPLPLAKL